VLAGLMAKGGVESVFEKHRLALLIGVSIGLVHAARAATAPDPRVIAGLWDSAGHNGGPPALASPRRP
jgi:hypothetical protein